MGVDVCGAEKEKRKQGDRKGEREIGRDEEKEIVYVCVCVDKKQ